MAKKKLSKADIAALMENVNIVTLLNAMRFGNQFVEIEKDDDGELAIPPAVKSLHSHVMTDVRTELKDAEKMAKLHNESDPDEDMGAGVKIKVIDNFKNAIKDVENESPIKITLKFAGKSVTFQGGTGRTMGAAIAGVRLATEWMTDSEETRTGVNGLDRKLCGGALPDGRAFVMEDLEKPRDSILAPFALAFGRGEDQSIFIDGFNAAKELFGAANRGAA